jgi:hypothetical protein
VGGLPDCERGDHHTPDCRLDVIVVLHHDDLAIVLPGLVRGLGFKV